MIPRNWADSGREWHLDVQEGEFQSPVEPTDVDDFLISDFAFKDGTISATITIPAGGKRDASFVFRHSGDQTGYLAGIGGWDSRFLIAKMQPDNWQLIAAVGRSEDLKKVQYQLSVEFSGPRIRLFENQVLQLTAYDQTYSSGRCGLQASGTSVKFSEFQVVPQKRRCFIAMPFHPSFADVYGVISTAVLSKNLECVRVDELYGARPIVGDIHDEMRKADIVIADLTDRNPNVYYEAGLAHASGKHCILIARSSEDLAFDLKHIRTLFYGELGPERLRNELEAVIEASLKEE